MTPVTLRLLQGGPDAPELRSLGLMDGVFKKPYVYAGAAAVLAVGWAVATGGAAILHGHISYWVAYGLGLAVGVGAILLAFRWSQRPPRVAWSTVGTVSLLLLVGILWWLRPYVATDAALDALETDARVEVHSTHTEITMTPTTPSGVGLIFLPGAKVDARAYGRILRPLAEAGHTVVIVKEPLGIAFLASAAAPRWAAAHPEIDTWVVAGHSLGGVVAAQNAAEPNDIDGLVLWASFPANDLSAQSLSVISVFGTNDGLTKPDRIVRSRSDLPPDTEFVAIDGAIHAYFGDYGTQSGDGIPSTSREEAQAEIISATLGFLDG